ATRNTSRGDASVVLARVLLLASLPRRAILALRLVRLGLHGLLRALAHVAARLLHIVLRRFRTLRHVLRRALGLVLDVDRCLIDLLAQPVQPAGFLHTAAVRARRIAGYHGVVGAHNFLLLRPSDCRQYDRDR